MADEYNDDEQPQEDGDEQYDEPAQDDYAQEAQAEPEPEVEEPEAEPQAEYQEEEPQQKEPEPEPEVEVAAYDGNMPQSVSDACNDIYSDNPSFNWFSTKLVDPNLKKDIDLTMDKVGTGGLNELVQAMRGEEDNIVFFLLRCDTTDEEGSSRAKFVYGRFVGTKIKFMQKARLTPNLGALADKFQVKHLSKDADEAMKGWTAAELAKEFLRIGGAHKPNKFNFGPGAVFEVEK